MLPASDASAPFGIRIATGAMCSNESGIDSRSTRIGEAYNGCQPQMAQMHREGRAVVTETAQQYITRIAGHVGDRDPWTLLAEAPERLRSLVDRASPGVLTWKRTPESWSIAEIAAHLADAEIVAGWRIRSILAQDQVPLQPFDQNAWASAFAYADTPAKDSAALFAAVRQATLQLLGKGRSRAPSARRDARRARPRIDRPPHPVVRRPRPQPPGSDRAHPGRGALRRLLPSRPAAP